MHLYLRSHTVEMNIVFAIMVLENKRGLHKCDPFQYIYQTYREETKMRMSDTIYFDKLTDTHKMPEWIRAERYEYCEDFYGSMTEDKSKSFFARLLTTMTSIFA